MQHLRGQRSGTFPNRFRSVRPDGTDTPNPPRCRAQDRGRLFAGFLVGGRVGLLNAFQLPSGEAIAVSDPCTTAPRIEPALLRIGQKSLRDAVEGIARGEHGAI